MRNKEKKTSNDSEVRRDVKQKQTRPSKGKRFNSKDTQSVGKSQAVAAHGFAGTQTNDPAWYTNNAALTRDVGSIVFSRPTGLPIAPGPYWHSRRDPGIMVLRTVLNWGGNSTTTLGISPGDPINMTATKLYQYVVHANSRNVSYDKKDLLMTLMAIDSVWQLITEAIRVYRLTAQYDVTNLFMSKLVSACGWDADNIKSNVAQFRYFINYAITRVNRFFVPNLFDMWKLHGSAYANVYLDEPSSKAQYIVKVPMGYWIYDDTHGDLNYVTEARLGISLTPTDLTHSISSAKLTVQDFANLVNWMISNIENSQYLGIIQGDLLKAFGYERMAQFNYLDIDAPLYPVFDEEFSFKLHNADLYSMDTTNGMTVTLEGSAGTSTSLIIYRDTDAVDGNIQVQIAALPNAASAKLGTLYIDMPDGIEPTADKVMVMSLYKYLTLLTVTTEPWRQGETPTPTCYMGPIMPEIINDLYILDDPDNISAGVVISGVPTATDLASAMKCFDDYSILQRFRNYPMAIVDSSLHSVLLWITDNFAEITDQQLYNINTNALWSLWSSSTISAN